MKIFFTSFGVQRFRVEAASAIFGLGLYKNECWTTFLRGRLTGLSKFAMLWFGGGLAAFGCDIPNPQPRA